jgi:hypothetical protein
VAKDVRSMLSLPRRKKADIFGLLWGGLRSGDSWRCGLRTASLKEEGGARVTRWPVAWGGTMLEAHRRSGGKSARQERGAGRRCEIAMAEWLLPRAMAARKKRARIRATARGRRPRWCSGHRCVAEQLSSAREASEKASFKWRLRLTSGPRHFF